MKIKKKQHIQRRVMENKVCSWQRLRTDKRPPNGWLKAIRGALGFSTRQLADRLGVQHSSVLRLEKREVKGKVSIESLDKAAQAMNCKLIYAIVPKVKFKNLNDIIEQQAIGLASHLVKKARHTMKLESQDISDREAKKQVSRLAAQLKMNMDPHLWNKF